MSQEHPDKSHYETQNCRSILQQYGKCCRVFAGMHSLPKSLGADNGLEFSKSNNPGKTLEEKRQYLNQACEEDWIIALEHDPKCEAIRLQKIKQSLDVRETLRI